MPTFRDATIDVREPKSARLEQRTKPRVKEMIERAASTLGVDTSDFIISAAYLEATTTLQSYARTKLDREGNAAFFDALDGVAAPNDAMRDLMKTYEQSVINPIK